MPFNDLRAVLQAILPLLLSVVALSEGHSAMKLPAICVLSPKENLMTNAQGHTWKCDRTMRLRVWHVLLCA